MRLIDEGTQMPAVPSKDLAETFKGRLRVRKRAVSTAIIDGGICIATTYTKDGNQSPIKQSEDAVNVAQWLCKAVNEYSEMRCQLAALKEENERLADGLSHHMNISQVLADGNANMYEMVMERDAEIELLKARVAELEAIGKEMASDLESEICTRYGINNAQLHPALENKFKRDMDVVHRFRQRFDMEEPANEG